MIYDKEFIEGYDHYWNNEHSVLENNPYEKHSLAWFTWRDGWFGADIDFHETEEE